MDNVISIFDATIKKKAAEKSADSLVATQVENIRSRLDSLFEMAEEISADISKVGADEIVGVSKDRMLGYFDSLLDHIDDTSVMFLPTEDGDNAG